ncbi:MAG: hypothetical protein HONBIEJF_00207 [Fimbriimonadaceae bacterium]|nr:hypothetical protein [Fimbriimonadaceae bacterium]
MKNLKHVAIIAYAAGLAVILASPSVVGCGGGGTNTTGGTGTTGGQDDHLFGSLGVEQGTIDNAPGSLIFGNGSGSTNVDLSTDPAMPAMGNQRRLPSCVAWTIGNGLATYEAAKASGQPPNSNDRIASPIDLYVKTLSSMTDSGMQGVTCQSGSLGEHAMNVLVRYGVASEAEMPYVEACINPSSAQTFRLKSTRFVRPSDVDVIKNLLENGHPVALMADTYTDFQEWGRNVAEGQVYQGSGVVNPLGKHAMLIVGYSDSKGAFKIRNSWGTGWGNGGYFWMSYATFAATAIGCFAADQGGTTDPTPPPGSQVTFSAFDSVQYRSYSSGIYYIVHPFQLSEPAFITRGRLIYEDNGASTPWFQVNFWISASYAWWAQQIRFPQGQYSMEIEGVKRDGQPFTLKGTAALHDGGWTRNGENVGHVEASRADQEAIRSLPKGREGQPSLGPGQQVVVNGHLVTLVSRQP